MWFCFFSPPIWYGGTHGCDDSSYGRGLEWGYEFDGHEFLLSSDFCLEEKVGCSWAFNDERGLLHGYFFLTMRAGGKGGWSVGSSGW